VPFADLTAEVWLAQTGPAATGLAQSLAAEHDLRFAGLSQQEYAGRAHRVALFDRAGMLFALVPGGEARLGYDGGSFAATPEQAESYAESAQEYGLPPMHEYLETMTSPRRSVELPAMLVAVEPFSVYAAIDLDEEDEVEESYEDAVERVQAMGLRLSTPDEWEYACGAGASSLFRWGNSTPDAVYPVSSTDGPHTEVNLWGLKIGQDPYNHEMTSVPEIVCGGDGGTIVCGGNGYFLGWLTLATAYRDAWFGSWLLSDEGYLDEILVRPVISLR
jgi:formylglycine-generating enzyme required for sulfatase activity